jgi:hypothetical protein
MIFIDNFSDSRPLAWWLILAVTRPVERGKVGHRLLHLSQEIEGAQPHVGIAPSAMQCIEF